jgi:hypothetical protein
MVYGPKSVLFAALLILSGCTREEATASLRAELQVDEFEIIHARFPCRSPDMHFFGYRFRIGLKGEYAFGDICWDASAQKWTWQILPDYPLSRLKFANSDWVSSNGPVAGRRRWAAAYDARVLRRKLRRLLPPSPQARRLPLAKIRPGVRRFIQLPRRRGRAEAAER